MEQLPPRPDAIRTLTNDDAARLNAHESMRRFSPDRCPTCLGKKTFRWYKDDARTEIVDFECSCFDQYVTHRYLSNAGIGLNYQRMGWADLLGVDLGVIERLVQFMENPDPWVQRGRGWFLYGSMGTGKTLIANLMLKNLLSNGYDGYFTTFVEMLTNFKSTWNSQEERRWFYRKIKNTGILVVDDPGREGGATWAESTLDEVIRHRISDCRPTFITTNHSVENFELRYGVNIASLLLESSETVEVTGTDYRAAKAERDATELRLGLTRPIVLG